VFDNLNWFEIVAIALIALFIFGPERLPKVIGDAARMLRQVRSMARNATTELREELGTDIDVEDLNPKTFVRKHLLSEEDEEMLRRPLRDAWADVEDVAKDASSSPNGSTRVGGSSGTRGAGARRLGADEPAPYDDDTT